MVFPPLRTRAVELSEAGQKSKEECLRPLNARSLRSRRKPQNSPGAF